MFPNLKAEMARHNVRTKDIATVAGIAETSANNKIAGRTPFTLEEAIKIRDNLFPGMEIDYLFSNGRFLI